MIIFLSSIEGINDNTGHQWRILQGINLSYINRQVRKKIVKYWLKELDKGITKFTWKRTIARYPYLRTATRRYFYKPSYYIKNLKEIPLIDVEKEVVSSLVKDFSSKAKRKFLSKIRKIIGGRNKKRKKK